MQPRFPLYIPTKGRPDSRLTIRALEAMGTPFHAVIEEQEFDEYAKVVDPSKLLILDPSYQRNYNTCDDLGDTKSKGPGAARNFAWDHAISNGHEFHWVMDDNIRDFQRLNRNQKVRCGDGSPFYIMEEFVLRYRNISMAGPQYAMFAPRKKKWPPFVANTRIYSCNLIRNDVPYRWRGRYNEDTDLSLCMLKDGWCTVQFNIFLQNKVGTQMVKGGNTEAFYAEEGTLPKSQMQVQLHPDVSRLVQKWGRWHHHVDYRPFRANKLMFKDGVKVLPGTNEFGLTVRALGS